MGRPKLIKVDVTDGRGLGGAKRKTVDVQTRIPDIMAYRDTPGFAYLLLAANPGVPVSTLQSVLEAVGPHQDHPATWMYKRRELFKTPAIPQGVDARAVQFVSQHMDWPAWKISKQMRRIGLRCSVQCTHRIWMALNHASRFE